MRHTSISPLNPFKMAPEDNTKPARYHSGHLDTELQFNLLRPDQARAYYLQKVERGDRFRFMCSVTENDSITLEIIDVKGTVWHTIPLHSSAVISGNLAPDGTPMTTYLYRMADYSVLDDDGVYFLLLTVEYDGSNTKQWISEPLKVQTTHPGTMLFEYKHRSNKDGAYFEQLPVIFPFRVEASIGNMRPESADTVFNDQNEDQTLLDSVPFRSWTLYLGHSGRGICDWVQDKVNRIYSCSQVLHDQKQYQKAKGARWNKSNGDPLYSADVEILEGTNTEVGEFSDYSALIFTAPSTPYAVQNIYIGAHTLLPASIVADLTAEAALIASLNTLLADYEYYGNFSKVGSDIVYTAGPGEGGITGGGFAHATSFGFTYNSPGSGGFGPLLSLTMGGGSMVVEWGDGAVTGATSFFPTPTSHMYGPVAGAKVVKVWGGFQSFSVGNIFVAGLTGTLPLGLTKFTMDGATFPSNTFSFTPLATAPTLQELTITDSGLTNTSGLNLINFPALRHVNFNTNPFNSTTKSTLIQNVYNNAFNNNLSFGTLNVAQSPMVAMNAAGNFYKAQLSNSPLFWTVNA